jgi:hypothetical protein
MSDVLNPVDAETKIQELADRIAKGVGVVTAAERESRAYKQAAGSIKERELTAEIQTMPFREEADNAEIAYRHAERTAKALEKELLAWQSINSNMRAMYGAVRV